MDAKKSASSWCGRVATSALGARCTLALLLTAILALAGCQSEGWNLLARRSASVITHANHVERLTDGVTAPQGGEWTSNLTSVIATSGGVEWDLGAPEKLTAAWLQGDNNDVYAVLGSMDGKSWVTVWEAEPVPPGGLQVRSTRGLDARARYVRLEPRGGDGNYSVAEFALYRSANADFPSGAEGVQRDAAASEQRELNLALALAALIAALGTWLASFEPARRRLQRLPLGPTLPALLLLCALVVGTALLYRHRYRDHTIDDAYISFQYAKNWAMGNGLVFNPGERVEGYSNFLWIALLTPLWPLVGQDADAFAFAVFICCLLLAVGSLTLLAHIGRSLFAHPLAVLLPLCLLAFDDAFTAYAVFSLENELLILLLLVGLWAFVRRFRYWDWTLGASLALVAMTRPDGALWGAVYVANEGLSLFAEPRPARRARALALARSTAAFLGLFAAYFAARYAYYGAPFPNTFYLKVGDTLAALPRGRDYLSSYFSERWWLPLAALTGVVALRRAWARWLFTYAILHMAYVVYVGGDFYSGHRFLMGLTPLFGLLTAAGLDAALRRWPARNAELTLAAAAFAAVVLVRFGTLMTGPGKVEIEVWGDTVDRDVRYMKWLKSRARPGASLALGDIGGAGFFGDLRVIDVYGVVDPAVARKQVENFGTGKPGHEKVATTEEVLQRKPTYIKLGFVPINRVPDGYYAFSAFPPGLDVPALLVRDDLASGRELRHTVLHFETAALDGWSKEGAAFHHSPCGQQPGQQHVMFARGRFINSFTQAEGDRARGRLLSPPFALEGDWLRFLLGGGRDPVRLTVSLLVDGQRVYSETGRNHELLGRREWDIRSLRGKVARLEIVDQAVGPWGHILVDEVSQWLGTPSMASRL